MGAKWYYSRTIDGIPPANFTGYIKIESVLDTLINGTVCNLLVETHENNSVQDSLYMYEDANDKVFYFNNDSNRFCLLYDFNVLVGDSFELDCIADPNDQAKNIIVHVDSISQININGEIKRMQYYRSDDNLPGYRFFGWVIEDIGNYTFMFPTIQDGIKGPLRCYEDNSLGFYTSEEAPYCNYVTGIEVLPNTRGKVEIFPSPFMDKINLNSFGQLQRLTVTNLTGKQVYHKEKPTHIIDLSFLEKGIYFITITTDQDKVSQKIIKL